MGLVPKEYFKDEPRRMVARVFDVDVREESFTRDDGQEVVLTRVYFGMENPNTGKALPSFRLNLSRAPISPWRTFCKALEKLGFDPEEDDEQWLVGKTFQFEQQTIGSGRYQTRVWIPTAMVTDEELAEEADESSQESSSKMDIPSALIKIFEEEEPLTQEVYNLRVVKLFAEDADRLDEGFAGL